MAGQPERDALVDYLMGELYEAHERVLEVYEGSADVADLAAWVMGRREDWVAATQDAERGSRNE